MSADPIRDALAEYRRANQAHTTNPDKATLVRFQEAANAIYRALTTTQGGETPAVIWKAGYAAAVADGRAFDFALKTAQRNDQITYKLPASTPCPY